MEKDGSEPSARTRMEPALRAARVWLARIVAAAEVSIRDLDAQLPLLFNRSADLPLLDPGLISPNGSCRIVRASDGWLAVNLPRSDDMDLVPAWLRTEVVKEPWETIQALVQSRRCRDLIADAIDLGLPVAGISEVPADDVPFTVHLMGERQDASPNRSPLVIDMTSMWAGPLCADLLAQTNARVIRLASSGRPDPGRWHTPRLYARLNGRKEDRSVDLNTAKGRRETETLIAQADMVVTSARPRAFAQLDLLPEKMISLNPGLIWIAITGHGWRGARGNRVAFGDDAAAAGGLVWRNGRGEPEFRGDALADPLTGLAAAAAGLEARRRGMGAFIDVSMAGVAAHAAGRVQAFRP